MRVKGKGCRIRSEVIWDNKNSQVVNYSFTPFGTRHQLHSLERRIFSSPLQLHRTSPFCGPYRSFTATLCKYNSNQTIWLRSPPLNACTRADPEGNQAEDIEAAFPHQLSRTQNVTLDFPTVGVGRIYAQCLVSVCYQLCCRRAVNTGTPLYTHWTGTLMLKACGHFQCVHIPQRDLLEGSHKKAGRQTRCFHRRWCSCVISQNFPREDVNTRYVICWEKTDWWRRSKLAGRKKDNKGAELVVAPQKL